jgi:hypothetical protein
VLVVEDAEAIRAAVLTGLAEAGFDATGRPDGRTLEDDLDGYRPDLVVLDVMTGPTSTPGCRPAPGSPPSSSSRGCGRASSSVRSRAPASARS